MTEEPITGAAIYKKLVAVYKDVTYIQKDKRNAFHNYTYASEAAIKDRLHEAFAKHGLVMLPPEMVSIQDVEQTTDKGKRETVTTIEIRFGIADMESGESVSGKVYGRGVDSSDKGVYKAITGGLKYFLTTTFLIPTGDDPEEESKPAPKQNVIDGSRAAQVDVLKDKLKAAGLPVQDVNKETEKFGNLYSRSPVDQMLARIKDKYSALAEFKRMKEEFAELFGDAEGEMRYYDSLSAISDALGYEVKKSDQFKTLGDSKKGARTMQEALMKIGTAGRFGVSDADIQEPVA